MPNTTNTQLNSLQSLIIVKKNYVMALHRRIAMAGIGSATKTDYEKNEIDILVYETLNKVWHTEKQLKQLEQEYENLMEEFLNDLAEVNEHYETFLELAKKHQSDNISIKHLLHSTNWKIINEDNKEKIAFYKSLKVLLADYFLDGDKNV